MGLEEAIYSGELQGADEHEPERVRVQLPSSPHFFPCPPVLPDPPILAVPPLPYAFPRGCRRQGAGLVLDHGAAASSGTMRGGSCEGGLPGPRGRPGLSRAPARTPPISEEPLRGVGGWENSLLAVTGVDEES